MNIPQSDVKVFEMACWHHLRNTWFDNVLKMLDDELKQIVMSIELPANVPIHTDVVQLLRAIKKECTKTCNYAKGHGDQLQYFLKTYYCDVYVFPYARACRGTRQDIGFEGCHSVLMNLPILVAFLWDRMSVDSNNLLIKSLFMTLQCVEFIVMLRVQSIVYLAIILRIWENLISVQFIWEELLICWKMQWKW